MKKYNVAIAPGYSTEGLSLTDGVHGCTVKAKNLDEAERLVLNRAKKEGWSKGHFLLSELDKRGVVIKPFLGSGEVNRVVKIHGNTGNISAQKGDDPVSSARVALTMPENMKSDIDAVRDKPVNAWIRDAIAEKLERSSL